MGKIMLNGAMYAGGNAPTYQVWEGTPTQNVQSDSGPIFVSKIDFGSVAMILITVGGVHPINGIPSSTEYTPMFTFPNDCPLADLDEHVIFAYGKVDTNFDFTRFIVRSSSNSIGIFYGYTGNAWFNGQYVWFITPS
jgi:hypothetical protein